MSSAKINALLRGLLTPFQYPPGGTPLLVAGLGGAGDVP